MTATTVCYIEKDSAYLMLHRIKKENDINKDKWIGIGGKLERFESPLECVRREVKEETNLILNDAKLRGVITFVSDDTDELMFLYTARSFEGVVKDKDDCSEGVLEWVKKDDLKKYELWEGDYIFLDLLEERDEKDVFELKLVYEAGRLVSAVLDGAALDMP